MVIQLAQKTAERLNQGHLMKYGSVSGEGVSGRGFGSQPRRHPESGRLERGLGMKTVGQIKTGPEGLRWVRLGRGGGEAGSAGRMDPQLI